MNEYANECLQPCKFAGVTTADLGDLMYPMIKFQVLYAQPQVKDTHSVRTIPFFPGFITVFFKALGYDLRHPSYLGMHACIHVVQISCRVVALSFRCLPPQKHLAGSQFTLTFFK